MRIRQAAAAAPPPSDDWAFLTPWRDVLRPLLEYVDDDELAVGTLDSRLQSLRLHFNDAHPRLNKARRFHPEFDNLVSIREALELIGLVLHYDKRAWKEFLHPLTWDQDLASEPFQFDECIEELEPLFKLTLHDPGPDNPRHFDDLCKLFTLIPANALSDEYYKAKQRIERTVGSAWNQEYRVPLWIVMIPKKGIETASSWVANMRRVIEALESPDSTFQLVSLTVLLFWARLQMWIVDFVEEVRVANVTLKQFGLPLWQSDRAMVGIAVNAVMSYGQYYHDRGPVTEWLSVEESAIDAVIAVCSATVEAKYLERLELCEIFPVDKGQREVCWRWLGYALTNRFHESSVRIVKMFKNSMSLEDVEHFLGTSDSALDSQPLPPDLRTPHHLRYICLDSNASIFVGDLGWRPLRDLRLGDQEQFTLLNDDSDDDAETVQIVVPGFGLCQAKCEDIVDAGVLSRRESRTQPLESLELDLESCEAPSLPLFIGALGSHLVKLCIIVDEHLTLSQRQTKAILEACPLLESLHLHSVNIESMATLIDAYRDKTCHIRVLSLGDSFVSSMSMMLFAWELGNIESRVCQCLREFRYIYEVIDPSTGKCPWIFSHYTISLFKRALQYHTPLRMLDIGLTKQLYDKHSRMLQCHDRTTARVAWQQAKAAFLSVFTMRQGAPNKRARSHWRKWLDRPEGQDLASHMLSFARPRLDCAVSVIYVPREEPESEPETEDDDGE